MVFTDRGDLAHSVNPSVLEQALKDAPVDVYVIATGEKVSRPEIAAIGHSGIFISNDPKAFKKGFDQVTAKLATASDGRYIFSYCTPKRKGDHKLRLEIAVPGDTGDLTYEFSADSFKAGCTPKKRPSFSALTAAQKPKARRPPKPNRIPTPATPTSSDRVGRDGLAVGAHRGRSEPSQGSEYSRKLARSASLTVGSPIATSSSLPSSIQLSSSLTSANRWSNESTT